ncbi:MAG: class I SAM-dependent methyltransferase, partial [Nanoarchaeota archaeon]
LQNSKNRKILIQSTLKIPSKKQGIGIIQTSPKNQKEIWDAIASEWTEFKTTPAEHVLEFLKNKKGNILDLGSGSGRHLINLKTKGKMHLVDFSKEMIKLAKKRAKKLNIEAEFFVADIAKLPFEDNYFDSAICIAVLTCIHGEENRKKVIEELFRVLKPGAETDIGVWNFKSKRFKNSKKEKYIRWTDKGLRYYYFYEEKEIHDLFKDAGFKIKSTHNSEMMINFIAQK